MTANVPNAIWEREIYGAGRFPRCPYAELASFVYRNEPKQPRHQTRILEVGCGAGNNLWFFAHEGFQVAGTDCSESALSFARHRIEADGLTADLRHAAFPEVPFPDNSFEFVLDRAALSYVPVTVAAVTVAAVQRVLVPGGKFLFCPYAYQAHNLEQALHYSEDMVKSLFKDGWNIIQWLQVTTKDVLSGQENNREWKIGLEKVGP